MLRSIRRRLRGSTGRSVRDPGAGPSSPRVENRERVIETGAGTGGSSKIVRTLSQPRPERSGCNAFATRFPPGGVILKPASQSAWRRGRARRAFTDNVYCHSTWVQLRVLSCGVCEFCRVGLQTSCLNGGFWNDPSGLGTAGGQAEAVRVPLADGTLVTVPDVDRVLCRRVAARLAADAVRRLRHRLARGHPGRRRRGQHRHRDWRRSRRAVGRAVGQAARRRAHHPDGPPRVAHRPRPRVRRHPRGRRARRRRHQHGPGPHRRGRAPVLEAVGHLPAYEQALGIVRPGGVISRVGVPQYSDDPIGWSLFGKNATLTGGPAPCAPTSSSCCPACSTARRPRQGLRPHHPLEDIARATPRWTPAKRSR